MFVIFMLETSGNDMSVKNSSWSKSYLTFLRLKIIAGALIIVSWV